MSQAPLSTVSYLSVGIGFKSFIQNHDLWPILWTNMGGGVTLFKFSSRNRYSALGFFLKILLIKAKAYSVTSSLITDNSRFWSIEPEPLNWTNQLTRCIMHCNLQDLAVPLTLFLERGLVAASLPHLHQKGQRQQLLLPSRKRKHFTGISAFTFLQ